MPLEAPFTLVHEYRLERGEWSEQRFRATQRVLERPRPPRPGPDAPASYSMTTRLADGTRRLCFSSWTDAGAQDDECIDVSPDDLR